MKMTKWETITLAHMTMVNPIISTIGKNKINWIANLATEKKAEKKAVKLPTMTKIELINEILASEDGIKSAYITTGFYGKYCKDITKPLMRMKKSELQEMFDAIIEKENVENEKVETVGIKLEYKSEEEFVDQSALDRADLARWERENMQNTHTASTNPRSCDFYRKNSIVEDQDMAESYYIHAIDECFALRQPFVYHPAEAPETGFIMIAKKMPDGVATACGATIQRQEIRYGNWPFRGIKRVKVCDHCGTISSETDRVRSAYWGTRDLCPICQEIGEQQKYFKKVVTGKPADNHPEITGTAAELRKRASACYQQAQYADRFKYPEMMRESETLRKLADARDPQIKNYEGYMEAYADIYPE